MLHYGSIFEMNINVYILPISNNSSFHATIHHSGFTKTIFCRGFNVWIGDFTFFKISIYPMLYNSPIFKTYVNVTCIVISNNCGFHSAIHHLSFTKTGFDRNVCILMCNIPFFECSICFMFYYFSIFKTNINVICIFISNNSRFHTTIHHSGFAKSIYFCCHKLPLAFLHLLLHCCYKILFVLPMF